MTNRVRKSNVSGFTLVELVVTIILLGILSSIVIPRFSGSVGYEQRGVRDQTIVALRYAQKSAIAARRTVCVTFVANPVSATFRISSGYGASDCSSGSLLLGPDGAVLQLSDSTQSFSSAPTSLIFDANGRPDAAASISVSGLSSSLAITVEAETGYVH